MYYAKKWFVLKCFWINITAAESWFHTNIRMICNSVRQMNRRILGNNTKTNKCGRLCDSTINFFARPKRRAKHPKLTDQNGWGRRNHCQQELITATDVVALCSPHAGDPTTLPNRRNLVRRQSKMNQWLITAHFEHNLRLKSACGNLIWEYILSIFKVYSCQQP